MMRRIGRALVPLGVVIVLATLGYVVFWHWSVLDAVYMTAITVGTVGFREVHPLTPAGQWFTILVIVSGIVAGGYALARIFEVLLEGGLAGVWKERRMNRTIDAMRGHTILAGLGRVGTAVAETLEAEGREFVVIDRDEAAVEAAKAGGWLAVHGDASEESTLHAAGIAHATSLITALDSDAENLFASVSARSLNPDLFIVARSSHVSSEDKLLKGGANRVLTPNVIGGRRMAMMALNPTISDYLDLVAHGSGVEYRLQELELLEGSLYHEKTIAEARVRELTGAYILAVRHRDGRIDHNPAPDAILHVGDRLVVLGTESQVSTLSTRP